MIGRTLGRYPILEALGAGGMGEVWRARDPQLDREVALKVLPAELAADPERLARFEREARSLAAVSHPNIVTVYSVEEADGVRFLTMELVEGQTLEQAIPPGGLPLEKFFELAEALADAVAAAHERRVIHRDLKPQNVMVTREGRVKVLDFGLARIVPAAGPGEGSQLPTETLTGLTRQGQVLGTLAYMAPEQLEGRAADARSDVFALGAVLYQMATGKRPFTGQTAVELSYSILKTTPPSAAELRPELPRHLSRLLRLCLEKDPERRLQSAKDLRNQLADLESELRSGAAAPVAEPAAAFEEPPAASVPAAAGSRRRAWLSVAGVAVAALLVVLAMTWTRERPAAEPTSLGRSLAVLPLENLSGDPEQDFFADGLTDALITHLGQLGTLEVISRTSVLPYRGLPKPMAEIAAELGVDLLVEGAVLRVGDQVRVTAKLVEGAADRQLWAESYQRRIEDVLELQGEVARAIARAVSGRLTAAEEARLAGDVRSVDPEAYEAYLRGRRLWEQWRPESLWRSLEHYEAAVARDPSFAPAWVGIAWAHWALAIRGQVDPREALERAHKAVERALELTADLAEAHAAHAAVRLFGHWDPAGAEADIRRAIELNPSSVDALDVLSVYLKFENRMEESVEAMRRAHRLDPLSFWTNLRLGWAYYMGGQHQEALAHYRRTVELFPENTLIHRYIAWALLELGEVEEALGACERSPYHCGEMYAAAGERERARAILGELEGELQETGAGPFLQAAAVAEALGERERAVAFVQRGVESRSPGLPMSIRSPRLGELRRDPRVAALLAAHGLSP